MEQTITTETDTPTTATETPTPTNTVGSRPKKVGPDFVWHTSPSHGWLSVPRKLLNELNLLSQITPYSFQNGNRVYLEEDVDAQTFITAFEAVHGSIDSRIRDSVNQQTRKYESVVSKYAPFSNA